MRTTESKDRTRLLLSCACLFMMVAGAIVSSCGHHAVPGGDAGGDAVAPSEAGVACQPLSDAGEPEAPAAISFDGGVRLDQIDLALAIARCDYWSRCSSIAPYVLSECVDALRQIGAWHLTICNGVASNYRCFTDTITFPLQNAGLLKAVAAGVVKYDPEQELACFQALEAQGCHGPSLWEAIPACAGAFSCASDAGVDDAGADGPSGADGDAGCPQLPESKLLPCATAGDCADAGAPGGPYCVAGYCARASCGDSSFGCSFIEVGHPCDSDPPLLGASLPATPWATKPTMICSPGSTCAGLSPDGGLGICATAEDTGGPCVEGAAITGCRLGLVCQCGACHLSPVRGPCASGSCQVGVAYCDIGSDICRPIEGMGADCTAGPQVCSPELVCDSTTNTCERPSLF